MRVSELIRGNFQLIMIMLAWLIVGAYLGSVHFIFITATLVLFNFKNLTADMLMGFIFILVLSDSLETGTSFAKSYKNIYIILLFLFFIADVNNRQVFVNYYLLFIPYFIMGLIGLYYSPAMGTSAQKLLSYVLLYIIVPNYVIGAYLKGGKYFFGDLIFFLFIIMA
ncbi:MAG TPA: hypothetical protein VK177_02735, partial [Flavobacteriales bacterium]|nr:hypothetical protein [Flavobacteriales bacterium]